MRHVSVYTVTHPEELAAVLNGALDELESLQQRIASLRKENVELRATVQVLAHLATATGAVTEPELQTRIAEAVSDLSRGPATPGGSGPYR